MKKQDQAEDEPIFKTTVRFPADLHKQLIVRAISEGTTFERLVVVLIQKGLEVERSGSGKKRR